eukprot:4173058-Prymnesium_polylepis.1
MARGSVCVDRASHVHHGAPCCAALSPLPAKAPGRRTLRATTYNCAGPARPPRPISSPAPAREPAPQ